MTGRPFVVIGLLVTLCAAFGAPLEGQAPGPPAPPRPTAAASPLVPVAPLPIGTPPEELPAFEVASVKKIQGTTSGFSVRLSGGGRMTLPPVPLRTLITLAFGIRSSDQIVGEPGWSATDRFTINAKAEDNAPADQLLLMLRSLLAERFKLKYHAEQRERSVYVLTAPADWKPNDRIRRVDCTAGRGATPPATPAAALQMSCGSFSSGTGGIRVNGMPMSTFASLIGSLGGLGQVFDRTGLEGTYSFQLDTSILSFRSSSALASALGGGVGASSATSLTADLLPSVGEGPSLTTAVEDLGLKLERRKEQIDVLVIDSVSQPDPD